MKFQFYILFLIFLFLSAQIPALEPSRNINQYKHKVWRYEDGLPQNTITCISQSAEGYLWLGTKEGLVRFDGFNFELFDSEKIPFLTDDEIWDLYSDSKGALWIGTRDGLLKYSHGVFEKYTILDGLPENNIWHISEDSKGNIWIGTGGGGLSKFDGVSFINYSPFEPDERKLSSAYIWSIYEDNNGKIWVGTDGQGLYVFENERFTKVTEIDQFYVEYVFDITEDFQNNLYFATPDGLLTLKENQFDLLEPKDGLSHNFLWDLQIDNDGNLWIGTEGGGIFRSNEFGIENFNYNQGLSSNLVSNIFEDNEGNIWIATKGGGLNRLKDRLVNNLLASRGELSNDLAYCLYEEPEGTIWIGTSYGLNKINENKTEVFLTEGGLSSLIISSLTSDTDGNMWIGTDGYGVNKLSGDQFTLYSTENGLSSNSILSLFFDSNENLWIGTNGGGVNLFSNESIRHIDWDYFPGEFVSDFVEDNENKIWIATLDHGLFVYDQKTFSNIPGSQNLEVWSVYEDSDSHIWIACNNGIGQVKADSIRLYGEAEGLFDEKIHSIIEFSKNDFWFSSDEGIFRIDKKDIQLFENGLIDQIPYVSYGIEDGMEAEECSAGDPAVLKTSDGLLYYPTIKGVTIIDPSKLKKKERVPPVKIESIVIDGALFDLDSAVTISAATERIELRYTAFNFSSPMEINFQYKLEGFDNEWINSGRQRSATYTQLPPGDYEFKVRASLSNNWPERFQSASISKTPYFWETSIFLVFAGLIVIALPFGIYNYKIRSSEKRNKELEQLVQKRTTHLLTEIEVRKEKEEELKQTQRELKENISTKEKVFAIISHDLRSPFQGIMGFSDLLTNETENFTEEEIKSISEKINSLARNFTTLLNNLLEWARIQQGAVEVKKKKVNVNKIVQTVEANLQTSAKLKNITISNEVDENLFANTDENIITSSLLNLVMNAIKFSNAGQKVIIGANKSIDTTEISVQDFGIGIPEEIKKNLFSLESDVIRPGTSKELGSGIGLMLCNDLISSQGGEIKVESEVGEGTKFTIVLPN